MTDYISRDEAKETSDFMGKFGISEEYKEELVKRLVEFPEWIVASAWVYATALNKFGVDVSKEWKTVTEQRAALDFAYRQGRQDELERWIAYKEADT